jgi:hypothetical protein
MQTAEMRLQQIKNKNIKEYSSIKIALGMRRQKLI